jgi:hypothetical protein
VVTSLLSVVAPVMQERNLNIFVLKPERYEHLIVYDIMLCRSATAYENTNRIFLAFDIW